MTKLEFPKKKFMDETRYLTQLRILNNRIISFIENDDDFKNFSNNFDKYQISKNYEKILDLITLISKIANNHFRGPKFFEKINKILIFIKSKSKSLSSSEKLELFNYFSNNIPFLILLFKNKILYFDEQNIESDQILLQLILENQSKNSIKFKHCLYSEIKTLINEHDKREILNDFIDSRDDSNLIEENISKFEEKCLIGENDTYICILIRQDLVKEFITYVNQSNIKLTSKIKPSIFESNDFLLSQKDTALIEYATFYGSLQIFQYLKLNNVELPETLWLYAIHSNNPSMIRLLEDEQVTPEDKTYSKCLIEAIKCHHNEVSNYISEYLLNNHSLDNLLLHIYRFYNFESLPNGFQLFQLNNETHESLHNIGIPSSITEIEKNVFDGCSKLRRIVIPSSVTRFYCKFESCVSIEIIGDQMNIPYGLSGNITIKQISIRNPAKSICGCAFADCSSLTKVDLPSSVTSINSHAFYNCSQLSSINFPASLKSISEFAFSKCSSLTSIELPISLTHIATNAFSECSSLKNVRIPSSVNYIGSEAFCDCTSLLNIEIHSVFIYIDVYAFANCSSLANVELSSNIFIQSTVFDGCPLNKSVNILSDVDDLE